MESRKKEKMINGENLYSGSRSKRKLISLLRLFLDFIFQDFIFHSIPAYTIPDYSQGAYRSTLEFTFYPRPLNEKEGETMTIGSCFDEPLTIVLPTILSLPLLVLRSSFPSPYFLFSPAEPFQIADPDNSR